MRNAALFAAVLALATACNFENPIDWDSLVWAAPDSEDDWAADDIDNVDVQPQEIDQRDEAPADVHDIPNIPDVKDSKDAQDVEVVNPCPEGEYPDPQLMKCLKYPCCEVDGAWMLQMIDADGGAASSYAVVITQDKAFVMLDVLSIATGSLKLPESVRGTLTEEVLHLDGGDPGVTGFLMMDAKKVEKQLYEGNHIDGSYKLIINGEPTYSGQWTLTPN